MKTVAAVLLGVAAGSAAVVGAGIWYVLRESREQKEWREFCLSYDYIDNLLDQDLLAMEEGWD